MDHASLRELAAGAAIDDLDPAERRELDRHLAACGPCRQLSADLDDVVGELALAAPVLSPPADLRGQVMAALGDPSRPASAVVPGRALRTAPEPAVSSRTRSAPGLRVGGLGPFARWGGLAAAAVFAIVAVGFGVQNQRLDDQIAGANAVLADVRTQLQARQAAVAVAVDPGHRTVALQAEPAAPTAQAVVMFRPGTTDAFLVAIDLPATPEGRVYQLWFADASGVHALDTFHFDGVGAFVAPFGVDLASGAAAMITLEPEGGSAGDPGPQVAFGEL